MLRKRVAKIGPFNNNALFWVTIIALIAFFTGYVSWFASH